MNRPWSCHGYTRRMRRSEWRKNNASNRKYNTWKRAIPWRGPGAQHKRERTEKEKPRKSKDTAKVKDNVQESEQEQAPMKGSQKKQGKKGKTKDVGKGQGAKGKEQSKQANHHGKSLNQEEREKGKEAKEKDHECSESTVHEFDARCDRNRPVPPP